MRVRGASEADQGQTEGDAFLARGWNRRSITDPNLALYHWDVGVDAGVMLDSRRVPLGSATRGHQVCRRWTRQVGGLSDRSEPSAVTRGVERDVSNAPFAFTRRIAAEVTAFVQEEARS
jgi:hypothetical protein